MREPIYRSTVRLIRSGMYVQYLVEMEINRARTYMGDEELIPVDSSIQLMIVATAWYPTAQANQYPNRARITMRGQRLPNTFTTLLRELRNSRETKYKAGALWSAVEILAWHCIEKFQQAFAHLPIDILEQSVKDGAEFAWSAPWDLLPDIMRSKPTEVELILECAPVFTPSMKKMPTDNGQTVLLITLTTGDA